MNSIQHERHTLSGATSTILLGLVGRFKPFDVLICIKSDAVREALETALKFKMKELDWTYVSREFGQAESIEVCTTMGIINSIPACESHMRGRATDLIVSDADTLKTMWDDIVTLKMGCKDTKVILLAGDDLGHLDSLLREDKEENAVEVSTTV